jgi:hypothetical protein
MHERRVSGLHRSSPGYFGMPLLAFLVSPGRGQGATESFWHSDHGSHEYDSSTKRAAAIIEERLPSATRAPRSLRARDD